MDQPTADNVDVQLREGSGTVSAATAEGFKLQPGDAAELQQQALAQLQMPGLGIEFGLELMRQRAEQLEKLPSLAMEGQLPVGPLP